MHDWANAWIIIHHFTNTACFDSSNNRRLKCPQKLTAEQCVRKESLHLLRRTNLKVKFGHCSPESNLQMYNYMTLTPVFVRILFDLLPHNNLAWDQI